MNETFTILLVDDNSDVMETVQEKAKKFLADRNMTLNWLTNNSGKKVNAMLKNETVDIILLDQNINDIKGTDILKKLRDNDNLTDVLFYSNNINDKVFENARNFIFTVVVDDIADITRSLELLIRKNIQKWNDVVFLRGVVISKVIELELELNDFFISYFNIIENKDNFKNYVLENSYFSFAGKKEAFQKITKYIQKKINEQNYETKKDLKQLQDLLEKKKLNCLITDMTNIFGNRNTIAHCKLDTSNQNKLIKMGTTKTYNKNEINKLLILIKNTRDKLEQIKTYSIKCL